MSYCQNCADKEREIERLKGENEALFSACKNYGDLRKAAEAEARDRQSEVVRQVNAKLAAQDEAQKLREALKGALGSLRGACREWRRWELGCRKGDRGRRGPQGPGGIEMSNDSTAGCPKCAGLAACWCPPLSPIALDFEAAMRGLDGDRWLDKDALNAQLRALVARVAQEEREKCEGRIKEAEEESARRWGAVLRLQGERDDLRKLLRRVEAVAWFAVKFFNGGRIEIGRRQLAEFEPSNATLETYNAPEDGRFIITATGGTP